MDLQPAPGTASLDSLTDVSVSAAAVGDVLYVSAGTSWVNAQPDVAGLVAKAGSQTITGIKTHTANVLMDNAVELRFYELDANGSNYIGLRAPDSLTGDVSYTLPAAGTSGQFAKLGASNDISWASLAISDLSDNTDLALLAGRAGSQTIKGSPNSGEDLILQANNSSNGYVDVQASLGLKIKTLGSLFLEDSAGGETVALRATDPVSASYTIQLPAAQGTSGQVLQISGVGGTVLSTSWVTPGASVAHSALTGLSADDHTQYALLAGRSGGQTYQGGTAASNNLVLESTAHATKGQVQIAAGSVLALRAVSSNPGQIRLYDENESQYCGFKAPTDVTSNSVYTMPAAFPGTSKYLTSDSSGVLSWGTPGGGGSSYADITDDATFGTIDVTAAPQVGFDSASGFNVASATGNALVTLVNDSVPIAKIVHGSAGQVATTNGSVTAWGAALIAGGGTGLTSYTAGDTLYYASSTALSKLAIGTAGQQLSVNSGASAPTWVEPTCTEMDSWRFEYSSGSAVKLTRIGNGRLRVTINGIVYSSNSDVTASLGNNIFDSGAAVPPTLYYAYVRDVTGTLTIDFSTIAPTSHVPGVYATKTADTTRRYIGRVIFASTTTLTENEVYSAHERFIRTHDLVNDCRLSGNSSDPDYRSDQASVSTIYLLGYKGNRISLWNSNSGEWELATIPSTGASVALSGMTASNCYDVFASFDNVSPRVKLEILAWTDSTHRATAIVRTEGSFDGVYTLSGSKSKRYLGTIYATGATTTKDTIIARFIWNLHNQIPKRMLTASTSSYTGSANPSRIWNDEATAKVEFVTGLASLVDCRFFGGLQGGSSTAAIAGIGFNITNSWTDTSRAYSKITSSAVIGACTLFQDSVEGYNYAAAVMGRSGSSNVTFETFSLEAGVMG